MARILSHLLFTLFISIPGYSQFVINGIEPFYDKRSGSFLLSLSENDWGKAIVADVGLSDNSDWDAFTIDGIPAGKAYSFDSICGDKVYSIEAEVQGTTKTFYLQFTFLPILQFKNGLFGYEYVTDDVLMQSEGKISDNMFAKVKWRGGTTNAEGKHKRNYKLKFIDNDGNSKDQSFFGLRNDNNWILDAGQVDLFRMRNLIAAQIWMDFAKRPYYYGNEPKAQTSNRGRMVEVFLNDEYQGIFNLCEPIDRKQMKLKKYEKDGTIHGGLWKATSYGDATFWNVPEEYDNTKEQNDVWELKYPEIDDLCPSDYSTLRNDIMFVATSSDYDFNNQVEEFFDMPVLIDYYLFVQLTNGFDICGKNIYWAVYDKEESPKLTPAMWDLDCTMDKIILMNHYTQDYVSPTYPLRTPNNIFYRLLQLNTNKFKEKITRRYADLRENFFSTASLQERYVNAYERLLNSGASNREEKRWSYDTDISGHKLDLKKELDYICTWIEERMNFLDSQFSYNSTSVATMNNSSLERDCRVFTLHGTMPASSYKGIVISKGKKKVWK